MLKFSDMMPHPYESRYECNEEQVCEQNVSTARTQFYLGIGICIEVIHMILINSTIFT